VTNLVENALKYGGARQRVRADGRMAMIEIDDDGPGIVPAELERVFEPFFRRRAVAQPRDRRHRPGPGGRALVARAHGGDVTLHNRPEGGLRASVRLPF
jgi:two-component system OmpR family sensor kinase